MYTLKLTDKGIWRFLFPLCSGLCLFFWLILRIVVCSLPILFSLYETRAKWTSTAHYATMVLSTVAFMGLNFHWFYLLVRKAVRTFAGAGGGGKKKTK